MKKGAVKKVSVGILVMSLLAGGTTGAWAKEPEGPPPEPGINRIEIELGGSEYQISPRMTCFSFIYASIMNEGGGIFSNTITASVRDGYTISYTMKMEKSKDEESWSTVKSWSGSGDGSYAYSHNAYGGKGYYYRTTVTATGKQNGKIIEVITIHSGIEDYTV